ncbi:MAG: hypothetical protein RL081_2134 [Pseudomonadota bacterium]
MQDPKDNSRFKETGFPSLSWEEEDLPTRPTPLHERPLQARIDSEMEVIARHHVRIALAIEKFWGHRDCVEYAWNTSRASSSVATRTAKSASASSRKCSPP